MLGVLLSSRNVFTLLYSAQKGGVATPPGFHSIVAPSASVPQLRLSKQLSSRTGPRHDRIPLSVRHKVLVKVCH